MRLLLDTHTYLWWESDSPRLAGAARDAIADPQNEICVSIVSLWEVAIKVRLGKLDADLAQLMEGLGENGFKLLAVQPRHVLETVRLPLHHKDPFDRLLIATARVEGLTLVSDDARLPLYLADLMPCSGR
ncbi:MAG TPA: type II toxin-antitoxin system VapC family toxin [Azospirillum sp.]|nr:type II toxin-antitoxin system VapC family toxin [Azospirillum sp.]